MSIQAIETVFARSQSRGGTRLVLLALASHVNHKSFEMVAWPSIATMRVKAGLDHDRSVIRCLRALELAGEIRAVGTESRGRVKYLITLPTPDLEVRGGDDEPLTWESGVGNSTPDLGVTPGDPTPDLQVTPPLTPRSPKQERREESTDSVGPRPSAMTADDQPVLFGDHPRVAQPATTTRKPPTEHPAFGDFWAIYPSRGPHPNPRKPAAEKFAAAVKHGADPAAIIRGAENYAATIRREGTEPRFVAQAVTWLNQHRWQDQAAAEPARPAYDGSL